MTALGCWLVVVGVCDLVRAARDATPRLRRLLLLALGAALLLAAAVAFAVPWWLTLLWVGALALWVQASTLALVAHRAPARALALAAVSGGTLLSLLCGGAVESPQGSVPGPLGALGTEAMVLGLGVLLVQLATANVVVRLVLDAVGVPASDNEKSLKGGRLLGPMERLLITGLGMAGELTAAGLVVAAKGLLRFPELQRGARSGASDVTEYFLIGSFSSWLLALGGVAVMSL